MDRNTIISQSIIKEHTEKAVIDDVILTKMKNNDSNKKPEMLKSGVFNFETDIIWSIVIPLFLLHVIGIYGLLTFNYLEKPLTTLWSKYSCSKYFYIFVNWRIRFPKFSNYSPATISTAIKVFLE